MRKVRYEAAKVSEIVSDIATTVRLGDKDGECVLFLYQGKYYATGSLCPHQNAPLNGAPIVNGRLVCRRHGYAFDLKSGDCLTVGGYGLPVYEVEVEGDAIYISYWDFD